MHWNNQKKWEIELNWQSFHGLVSAMLFLIFFPSCKTDTSNIRISRSEVLTMDISDSVFTNPGTIQLVESDSANVLFLFNGIKKSLQFFEFPEGRLLHEIHVPMEGPDNLRGPTGGTLLAKDSIWFTFSPPAIGLMNFNGKLLFKKEIKDERLNIPLLEANQKRPLFQHQNLIFGTQPHFTDHHKMNAEAIFDHPLIYSYDMDADSLRWYEVYYPSDYWQKGKRRADFSWAKREDKLYLAPIYHDEIQVFDMHSGEIVIRKPVPSPGISSFQVINSLPSSAAEADMSRLIHDRYGTLLFDPYRDVFYRFFFPGFEPGEELSVEDLSNLNWSRPYTGITVFDKELNVLGHHLFDSYEVYGHANHFVGEEGLYVSINNEFHPDFDESQLRYKVVQFDLEK
ncbi:DUF4221 family protein [Cyclobacterium sp. SYSU L10401]|uniref:DUF4221 family protein n=1 Tax=Cyclobacterium sp. SYSU L10401 TaxID=2678657 RepID=UPI0013D1EA31|nr:DUF4221 family protein [Cyclobacterium sp. SYSU L10401]